MTEPQRKLLARIEARGGAMRRSDMTPGELKTAWALVDRHLLTVDGGSTTSRGPFNQASSDTLTFVTPA